VNDDNVIARVEGRRTEAMVRRLKILGYLVIHTRQLDMIMTREGIVEHYRQKLTEDIEKMLAGTVSDTTSSGSEESDG
jgi:pyruvate,water dikinase